MVPFFTLWILLLDDGVNFHICKLEYQKLAMEKHWPFNNWTSFLSSSPIFIIPLWDKIFWKDFLETSYPTKYCLCAYKIFQIFVVIAGVGLYLAASVVDHSCCPNANVIFRGNQLFLRSIDNIASFPDVRISYTNLLGMYPHNI